MRSALIALVLSAAAPALLAENLVLKNGGELSGAVTQKTNETLTIRIEGGAIILPLAMVQKVEAGGETLSSVEDKEQKDLGRLAAANEERKSRMLQHAASLEEARRPSPEDTATPASFRREGSEASSEGASADLLAAQIAAKLDLYRELVGEIRRLGLPESPRLRDAILSDLFPAYRGPAIVW